MMEESDFKKAWEAYHDMLYRLAVTMTKNMDASMDVVQDVMLRLFRHRGSFESDEHMKAWLIQVCINRCRDFLRSPWFLKETELDPRLYACMEKTTERSWRKSWRWIRNTGLSSIFTTMKDTAAVNWQSLWDCPNRQSECEQKEPEKYSERNLRRNKNEQGRYPAYV